MAGVPIAVKCVLKIEIWHEIEIMKMLPKNPYIVNAIGFHEYNAADHSYILMELCEGTLHQMIRANSGLNKLQLKNLMQCMVQGFKCLRSYEIVHGDLKPANILVRNGTFKIGDFGLSFKAPQNGRIPTAGGTPGYCHPSVFAKMNWFKIGIDEPKQGHPLGIDLYSIGATIYESITCKLPFYSDDREEMHKLLINKRPKDIRGVSVNRVRCYFSWLPKCSIQDKDLRKVLESLIRDLLQHDEDRMVDFAHFYEKCEEIIRKL